MISLVLALIPLSVFLLFTKSHHHRRIYRRRRLYSQLGVRQGDGGKAKRVVGFFHPYCNAGGGGERVLWTALAYMQRTSIENVYVIYTGDRGVSKESMIEKVQSRFGITLDPRSLSFVFLSHRFLIEDSTWPRFTLAGQSLGSVLLALEALYWNRDAIVPDVWIDTMGYSMTYPLVKYLYRIPILSYTHYPTISTDMLERVSNRESGHTNQSLVSQSRILTTLKLIYYRLFAQTYRWSLSCADLIWVNSTWTRLHIEKLLSSSSSSAPPVQLLYPPCDTTSLSPLPLSSPPRNPFQILSLSQFRPEKEHSLQLETLSQLFSLLPSYRSKVRLILAGSVRNEGDESRVKTLRELAKKLRIEQEVEFRINKDWNELRGLLGSSGVGLHTMFDEHFGITLVEFQAAGLIPLAHASAGPLLDILVPYPPASSSSTSPPGPTGYLASSDSKAKLPSAFAKELDKILRLSEEEQMKIRERARENAKERFGTTVFEDGWGEGWRGLMRDESEGSKGRVR
ncbi:alpha-1,2-mannosyltransferase ALG11 [Sporobolomyces salmoneus]|uniref:alpha-1,2-mannosyltransferase ALG11 n=1 Tax=Sporobolomyces salmoneus TaxID=183962 RepID=UPI00316EB434